MNAKYTSLRSAALATLMIGAIVIAGGALSRTSQSVFVDNVAVAGNTFTTAVTFPTPTPTPTPTSTGFRSPAAHAVDSGGDGDGYERDPTFVFADDGTEAEDRDSGTNTSTSCGNTGKDRHRFYNYGFSVPAGSTINGIEVRIDARVSTTSGTAFICVELSWDGGVSWTTAQTTPTLTTSEVTYVLGSSLDTWGRTWSATAELTNPNFRVRVTDVASDPTQRFKVDWIPVQVTYTPP